MHRGCVPFVSHETFKSHYWPTIKPIVQELWKDGHQVLFYAEGRWDHHLDAFAELPDCSIVYHVDMGDIFKVHKRLGQKFCLSGGIPNVLLSFKKPDDVRAWAKKVIDGVARDGGYIMDAGAIMQDDTSIENMKMMTQVCREHGVYASGSYKTPTDTPPADLPSSVESRQKVTGMAGRATPRVKPGVCFPWDQRVKDLPEITGDKAMVRRVWEDVDTLGNMYIWQMLLSF